LATGGCASAHPPVTRSRGDLPDWRPQFIDYLYLGFTTATVFSPTDVMPLRSWNKIAMLAQSMISLILLGLVIARTVNVLQ
jgi:hypothetical protein